MQRADEDALDLTYRLFKDHPRCNVNKENYLFTIVTRLGIELWEVLGKLGISRNKSVNNKSLKVQRVQAKRQMVGSSPTATHRVMATALNTGLSIHMVALVMAISLKPFNITYWSTTSGRRRPLKRNPSKSQHVELIDAGNNESQSNLKKWKLSNLPPFSSKVILSKVAVSKLDVAPKVHGSVDLKGMEVSFRKLATTARPDLNMEVYKLKISNLEKVLAKERAKSVKDKVELKAQYQQFVTLLREDSAWNMEQVSSVRDICTQHILKDGYSSTDLIALSERHFDYIVGPVFEEVKEKADLVREGLGTIFGPDGNVPLEWDQAHEVNVQDMVA
ncbi:hypothetical protein GIB67_018290 [Kingdonia uniflora]|uniref:Uncharacterized protein n=1 Tax=Kingdonia uniflora TaxID=39325 RepID=A0A7J7LF80_9MAGN|nr:hypothetical protein GIB67_018290 [Kingdonia uniflora]